MMKIMLIGNNCKYDWDFMQKQLQRYHYHSDNCLYRIGTHAELLTDEDINQIRGGELTPRLRSMIRGWLRSNCKYIGITIKN